MNGATLLNARFEILWLNNFSKTYHPAKEYIENFKKKTKVSNIDIQFASCIHI